MSKLSLSATFKAFAESGKSGGIVLVICTVLSLLMANSASGGWYAEIWHWHLGPFSQELWINDAQMAVFFLLIGLELEREL
jgi:NhaA family Na+:H+ antiporter